MLVVGMIDLSRQLMSSSAGEPTSSIGVFLDRGDLALLWLVYFSLFELLSQPDHLPGGTVD